MVWCGTAGEKIKIPVAQLTDEDKSSLEDDIANYKEENEGEGKITYVPVWLDDKVAHGHYDGYCKQSTLPPPSPLPSNPN